MNTHITLTEAECAVRFWDNTLLTVTDDGGIVVANGDVFFSYEPPVLRVGGGALGVGRRNTFSSDRLELGENTSLTIIIDRGAKLLVEIFFQEKEGIGRQTSGCYISKDPASSSNWSIRFLDAERFLHNLTALCAKGE